MSSRVHILIPSFAIVALCVLAPLAAGAAQSDAVSLTVYNGGRALITERRSIDIPAGQSEVEFQGVAETIEAETLQVRSRTAPDAFSLLSMNYEYDLIGTKSLLDKYVGQQLRVVVPDPSGEGKITRQGVLLANTDRPIFDLGGEIYVGDYEAVMLPDMPKGLRPRPTLVWLVDNDGPTTQQLEASYLCRQITWAADYVLKLSEDESRASLSGWITLDNQSGKAFEDATLKLVAGEVHQAPRAQAQPMMLARGADRAAQESVQAKEFFEYHLYTVGRPVTVKNRQTKQISLLQAPGVTTAKRLKATWSGYVDRGSSDIKQPVEVFLRLVNDEESGLGLPLPKGIVRAYQADEDGSSVFVGEDRIDHTPEGAEVELKMGKAFDVQMERTVTDFEKIGRNAQRYAWEIRIRNSRDETRELVVEEQIPGDWKIRSASHDYEELSAGLIAFNVMVPPSEQQGETVLTYEVYTQF
jgi:hypothetical protein